MTPGSTSVDEPAHLARDDRGAARRGLEGDQPEALRARRHQRHVGGAHPRRQQLVAWGATKLTCSMTPPRRRDGAARQGVATVHAPRVRPTIASMASRPALAKSNQRLEGEVHPLERLESTDEEQHGSVRVEPERPSGLGPVARGEERVLHARGARRARARARRCSSDELLRLDVATREHRVGAGEDRGLLVGAVLGLALEVVGLHPLQRVEGHDERHVRARA